MTKKWTIVFVMHALDSELKEHASSLVKLLEKTQWNLELVNVLYLKNSYTEERRRSRKRKIEARLFQIAEQADHSFFSEELKNYGQINIGKVINLHDIFSDIDERFSSERIMLFTWDHGSGFGVWEADPEVEKFMASQSFNFFGTRKVQPEKARNSGFFVVNNELAARIGGTKNKDSGDPVFRRFLRKELSHTNFMGKIERHRKTVKEEETDILTNDELASAIRSGFKGKKIDILIMVNCFMQMTETGYSLKDTVNYLVACETAFWAYGFDYASIFKALMKDPDISSVKIARLFISTVENPYRRIRKLKDLNDVVVSACNLEYAEKLARAVDELVRVVNADPRTFYPLIKKAREEMIEISSLIFEKGDIPLPYPLFIIDFLSFLFLLRKKSKKIKNLFEEIVNDVIFDKYLIARRVGRDFNTKEITIEKVNGISIYFPGRKKDIDRDYHRFFYTHNSQLEIEFSKKSLWSQFIPVYLQFR